MLLDYCERHWNCSGQSSEALPHGQVPWKHNTYTTKNMTATLRQQCNIFIKIYERAFHCYFALSILVSFSTLRVRTTEWPMEEPWTITGLLWKTLYTLSQLQVVNTVSYISYMDNINNIKTKLARTNNNTKHAHVASSCFSYKPIPFNNNKSPEQKSFG